MATPSHFPAFSFGQKLTGTDKRLQQAYALKRADQTVLGNSAADQYEKQRANQLADMIEKEGTKAKKLRKKAKRRDKIRTFFGFKSVDPDALKKGYKASKK